MHAGTQTEAPTDPGSQAVLQLPMHPMHPRRLHFRQAVPLVLALGTAAMSQITPGGPLPGHQQQSEYPLCHREVC